MIKQKKSLLENLLLFFFFFYKTLNYLLITVFNSARDFSRVTHSDEYESYDSTFKMTARQ